MFQWQYAERLQLRTWLKTGHCSPFVPYRRRYASVPEDVAPEDLTLERAVNLLDRQPYGSTPVISEGKRGPGCPAPASGGARGAV